MREKKGRGWACDGSGGAGAILTTSRRGRRLQSEYGWEAGTQ